MRIALVHSYYSESQPSGENQAVQASAAALRRAGHDICVASVRTDEKRGELLYAVRSAFRVATGYGASPEHELAAFAPDIVHIHNTFPNYGERWVADLRFPYVLTLHNYRPFCAAATLHRPGKHVCTDCPDGSALSAIRHKCYRDSRIATLPLAVASVRRSRLIDFAAAVVVLTRPARRLVARFGVPDEKLHVVPNFVPSDLDKGIGPGGDSWLYVGRFDELKGVTGLVDNWPRKVPLILVGSGPLEAEIRSRIDGRRIVLAGSRTRGEVIGLMRQSRGLAFPSLGLEGFPLVYAEALSTGSPVIARAGNSVSGLVALEGTGAVYSDVPDPDVHTARQHCRAIYEANYTESAHVAALEAVYGSVLSTPSAKSQGNPERD